MTWTRAVIAARTVGVVFCRVVIAVCMLFFLALGIVNFAGRDRPISWGNFTEVSFVCPTGSRSCHSVGTWLSDDGQTLKSGLTLDGSVGSDGTARAGFQPGGFMGDDTLDVVHTHLWIHAGLWFPWVAFAGCAAFLWIDRRGWPTFHARNTDAKVSLQGRHRAPQTPPPSQAAGEN